VGRAASDTSTMLPPGGAGGEDPDLGDASDLDVDADFQGFNVTKLSTEQRRSFRNSMRRASARKAQAQAKAQMEASRALGGDNQCLQFSVVPRRRDCYPLLVFVNPKSGGGFHLPLASAPPAQALLSVTGWALQATKASSCCTRSSSTSTPGRCTTSWRGMPSQAT
jgi:hypothetical protein